MPAHEVWQFTDARPLPQYLPSIAGRIPDVTAAGWDILQDAGARTDSGAAAEGEVIDNSNLASELHAILDHA